MGRPTTEHVKQAKRRLIARLNDGFHRPGNRFLSNRALARQFAVSYQTADRLIRELVAEGLLERRAASGTFVPGRRAQVTGVQLVFHRRARRKNSFGARLLRELTARLDRERIEWRMSWADPSSSRPPMMPAARYPVIWECPRAVTEVIRSSRHALLLNERPPAGLASSLIDSVTVDDFSGGACAAQLLTAGRRTVGNLAVLSGPPADPRSDSRVAGFLSVASSTVVPSKDWFIGGGLEVASRVVAAGKSGIFTCNDRLAEAVIRYCEKSGAACPPLVGFDDAPIAEALDLTTIAIPWSEMVAAAQLVIRRRLTGDTSVGIAQIIAPRPVIRLSR